MPLRIQGLRPARLSTAMGSPWVRRCAAHWYPRLRQCALHWRPQTRPQPNLGRVMLSVGSRSLATACPSSPHDVPRPTDAHIADHAHVLDSNAVVALDARLAKLRAEHDGIEVMVLTLHDIRTCGWEATAAEYRAFNEKLYRVWDVGGVEGNGVLITLFKDGRRVEVHAGRGLQQTFTSASLEQLECEHMVPSFKRGDYGEGIARGVEAVIETVSGKSESGHGGWRIGLVIFVCGALGWALLRKEKEKSHRCEKCGAAMRVIERGEYVGSRGDKLIGAAADVTGTAALAGQQGPQADEHVDKPPCKTYGVDSWQVFFDDASGRPYYHNDITGETVWEISPPPPPPSSKELQPRQSNDQTIRQGSASGMELLSYDKHLESLMSACERKEQLLGAATFALERCPQCGSEANGRTEKWLFRRYHVCQTCSCCTQLTTRTQLIPPSEISRGRDRVVTDCKFCGLHSERNEVTRYRRSGNSSSSGSSTSSSGGCSGGASWFAGNASWMDGPQAPAWVRSARAYFDSVAEVGLVQTIAQWREEASKPPPPQSPAPQEKT